MTGYAYFLVETSLGWHKVLPDPRVVLLCPTTVRAQTHYYAGHFCLIVRMGGNDRQPSEGHRRFVWGLAMKVGLPVCPQPILIPCLI